MNQETIDSIVDERIKNDEALNALRRMAKTMQKKLKSQGTPIRLSQCLDIVANGVGKDDWHKLIHDARQEFAAELKRRLPTTRFFLLSSGENNDETLWKLGQSAGKGLFTRNNVITTHTRVFGGTTRNTVTESLIGQAISKGMGVTILDGSGGKDAFLRKATEHAVSLGKDAKRIDLSSAASGKDKADGLIDDDGWLLGEILYGSGMPMEHIATTIGIFRLVRNRKERKISIFDIPEDLSWGSMLEAVAGTDITFEQSKTFSHLVSQGKNAYEDIMRNAFSTVRQAEERFGDMFSRDGSISCDSICSTTSDSFVSVILPDASSQDDFFYGRFFAGMIKTGIAGMFSDTTERQARKKRLLVLNSVPVNRGFAVIPAQARSMGISVVMSYGSEDEMMSLCGNDEALSMIANANLSISTSGNGGFIAQSGNETADFLV